MRLLEALFLGLLALAPPRAEAASFETVVTMDNGEFNMPLYTPRWNGQWAQPAVAQEIATSIARVIGENPVVYTYLAPGRTPGRPGEPYAVEPRLPRCVGAAKQPADPCHCGPADKCWEKIGPNYHPDSSTSLYLTAAAVRAEYVGKGPRLEVHFSDLFEEDPSAADNPKDLDRCVTADGTRKAVAGLMNMGDVEVLDHVAVGVLRIAVEPPPPGPHRGYTYKLFSEEGEGCWSGEKGFPWESLRRPYEMSVAVLVLGVGTARQSIEVNAFIDGLVAQLTSETMSIEMVRIREPASARSVERIIDLPEDGVWRLEAPERTFGVPCDGVVVTGEMESGGQLIDIGELTADCTGGAVVRFADNAIERAFVSQSGLDPRLAETRLTGTMKLRGEPGAIAAALAELGPHNAAASDRPMPLWSAIEPVTSDVARPLFHDITVTSLSVSGVDTRPWPLALIMALALGMTGFALTFLGLKKVQAERAFQSHWDRAVGPDDDPLRQRPLASIIADAQEEVRAKWPGRVFAGILVLLLASGFGAWFALRLYLVTLG